jgi:hypothetical protein
VQGIEDDTQVYVANIELEPGQWNIEVRVELQEEDENIGISIWRLKDDQSNLWGCLRRDNPR